MSVLARLLSCWAGQSQYFYNSAAVLNFLDFDVTELSRRVTRAAARSTSADHTLMITEEPGVGLRVYWYAPRVDMFIERNLHSHRSETLQAGRNITAGDFGGILHQ